MTKTGKPSSFVRESAGVQDRGCLTDPHVHPLAVGSTSSTYDGAGTRAGALEKHWARVRVFASEIDG